MCGISGIFNFESKINFEELKNFNNSLNHRGPDSEGYYVSDGIGLGHKRLKIIDLTENASQPMKYLNSRYIITYNGEIYNFKEIKKILTQLNYKFHSNSDTEVILASYDKWGEDCVDYFNGMWAFAIWDNLKKKIFISRDRFGVKPIYFMIKNKNFFFSSELKSFQKLNINNRPQININYFLNRFDEFLNEKTFFHEVKELKGGFNLVINSKKKVAIKRWWNTNNNLKDYSKINENEIFDEFKDKFTKACNLRKVSDAPIICTLSGGIDSTSVFYALKKKTDIKGIFLNINNYNYEDQKYIEKLVKGENGKDILINNIFYDQLNLNDFKRILTTCENIHGIHIGPYLIYKKINELGYKVVIDGLGSDEMLGGYQSHYNVYNKVKNFKIKNFISLINFLNYKILNYKKYFLNLDENLNRKNITLKKGDHLSKHLFDDFHNYTLTQLLQNNDRLSMRFGIEVRSPFLDKDLVSMIFSLNSNYKIKNNSNKYILRKSLKNLTPDFILNRKNKTGFVWHTNIFDNKVVNDFLVETSNEKKFIENKNFDGNVISNKFRKKLKNKNFDEGFFYLFRHIHAYILLENLNE